MNGVFRKYYPVWLFFIFVTACTKPPADLAENGKSYVQLAQLVKKQYQTEIIVNREEVGSKLLKIMEELEIQTISKGQDYIWLRGEDGMSAPRTSYYYYFGDGEFKPLFDVIEKNEIKLSNDDNAGLSGKWFQVKDAPF